MEPTVSNYSEAPALFSIGAYKNYKPADIIALAGLLITMHFDGVAAASNLTKNFFCNAMDVMDLTFAAYNQLLLGFFPRPGKPRTRQPQEIEDIMELFQNGARTPGAMLGDQIETHVKKITPLSKMIFRMDSVRLRRDRSFKVLNERSRLMSGPANSNYGTDLRKLERASRRYIEADARYREAASEAVNMIGQSKAELRPKVAEALVSLMRPIAMVYPAGTSPRSAHLFAIEH